MSMKSHSGALPLVVLAAALGSTGCFWVTTKSEGASLRKDVKQIDERLTNICRCGTFARVRAAIHDAAKAGATS